jgi:tetratricopeptide (TPR) repeat protein
MKKLLIKPLFSIILSFAIIFLSLEFFLQGFFPERIIPDLRQSQYKLPNVLRSNLNILLDWSHGYHYPPFRLQTNSKHFLSDQDFQYKKPENTFRILMLGNSIFMGLGVENTELFSRNLENILNERSTGKHIEIINFSGVAWSTIQFLTFLQTEGYKYHPDLVIVSQGENDFRVKYNKLIQPNKIEQRKLSKKGREINLEELKVKLQSKSLISVIWEWVRKFPYYFEISKHSQTLFKVRSKVNNLWNTSLYQVPKSKQLGHFIETQKIDVTKNTIISLNSDNFSVNLEDHSIIYFAKVNNSNIHEAEANIILHSATQVKISQLLSSLGSKLVVVDIPTWQEVSSIIKPIKTRKLNSNLKNYFYSNPTKTFKKFQAKNIEIPLYFFDNNHLSPAGHRLVAIIAYNFLVKKNLVAFQDSWEAIDPFDPRTKQWIKKANIRIEEYIKIDARSYKFRGLFYYAADDLILAKENLVQYLKIEQKDYEAHFLLGKILVYLKEFSSALDSFKKSFRGHPLERARYRNAYVFTEIYKNGWEHYENGKLEEALFFAIKLEKIKGELWDEGISFLYLIYQKLGQLKNAELYIKQALDLWPDYLKFKMLMASLKYDQKRYKEAINFSLQTLKSNDKNLKALLILGMSHSALGNKKEAKEFLLKYLKLNPNNKPAQKALLALKKLN